MANRYQIAPEKLVHTLKNTVIKPTKNHAEATNEEIAAFIMVANEYGLNPFTKEIHAFASQGGIVPIVGIDGWAKLINRRVDFNGCDFEERQDDQGNPVSTTCVMHVKGREHPIRVTEWFVECKRPTVPWNTMPRRMLRHKAFMQAARICFGLGGIYDEDEARDVLKDSGDVIDSSPPTGRFNLRDRDRPQTSANWDKPMDLRDPEERESQKPSEEPDPRPTETESEEPPDRQPGDDSPERESAAVIDEQVDASRNLDILHKIMADMDQDKDKLGHEYERLRRKIEEKIRSLQTLRGQRR